MLYGLLDSLFSATNSARQGSTLGVPSPSYTLTGRLSCKSNELRAVASCPKCQAYNALPFTKSFSVQINAVEANGQLWLSSPAERVRMM